jgi:hypothetical protein
LVANYNSFWAGYVDSLPAGQSFTSITGSWVVPIATCDGTSTHLADWIGLDNSTIEQTGTTSDCNGSSPSYTAWYEFFHNPSVNSGYAVFLSDPVRAGDVMTASVTYASGTFTLTISDATAGWVSVTPLADASPPAPRATAEWIVEPPVVSGVHTSLTISTPVTFTSATATTSAGVTGSLSAFSPQAYGLYSGSPPNATQEAYPSLLDPSGTSFTVTNT